MAIRTSGQKAYAGQVNQYIEVHGLKELVAAFRKLDPVLKRELQKELRQIAEPAARRAQAMAMNRGLNPYAVKGIRPGSRLGMAVVRISRKATTKDHPGFGEWQVRSFLEPAATETMPEARERLEAMLDKIANGFNSGAD